MRHRHSNPTLSRTAAARTRLARVLARSLISKGSVHTTHAKARFLRSFIEPLVTKAKAGDLSSRRWVTSALADREAAAALLRRAEQYRSRPGGYTRLTRLPTRRRGDASPLVQIEFV